MWACSKQMIIKMRNIFKKRKILVTHPGTFHIDDLFTTAVLSILLGENIKIIRTNNKEEMNRADFVYDVGGIYDKEKYRFDHHQKDGPVRENGIPYASLGLVWNKFGEQICGSKEVAKRIEDKIVVPIDAEDNGFDIYRGLYKNVYPYSVGDIFKSEIPTWKEDTKKVDKIFKKEVKKVIVLLKREIKIAKDDLDGIQIIKNAYEGSQDKRIIKLNVNLPRYLYQDFLSSLPEPLYVVIGDSRDGGFKVEAIRQDLTTKSSRKPFPESWRGEMDVSKLRELSGVEDIVFCHKSGFLAATKSEEGALALAEKALIV